ncbi:class II aldolase/adducin family protein [Mycolicibacterium hodleri]|uniref:class II aldolase/adducin family protein n=1 Tax=Mycolicibacterium hodleri TaxID=49897 RepID=UPI001F166F96|nr:class II aldolase/adducin family protein [Mycolicibacterium hodleri]
MDHEIFDDEDVSISSVDGGKRIAAAIGGARGVILRNHGLLTVGSTIDSAVGYFLLMECCAEVQMKARDAHSISTESARRVHDEFDEVAGWQVFQWAQRTYVPDRAAIG